MYITRDMSQQQYILYNISTICKTKITPKFKLRKGAVRFLWHKQPGLLIGIIHKTNAFAQAILSFIAYSYNFNSSDILHTFCIHLTLQMKKFVAKCLWTCMDCHVCVLFLEMACISTFFIQMPVVFMYEWWYNVVHFVLLQCLCWVYRL